MCETTADTRIEHMLVANSETRKTLDALDEEQNGFAESPDIA